MTNNQIQYQRLKEEQRSHLESERQGRDTIVESKRANLAKELLGQRTYEETVRSNLAKEAEVNRSNLAREMEANRSNVANESIKYADIQARRDISANQIAESALARQWNRNAAHESLKSNERNVDVQQAHEDARNQARIEQEDKSNTRSGFVSLLNGGVNAISNLARSIISLGGK